MDFEQKTDSESRTKILSNRLTDKGLGSQVRTFKHKTESDKRGAIGLHICVTECKLTLSKIHWPEYSLVHDFSTELNRPLWPIYR